MRVLIVGGGGREHALAWALARSPSVDRIYALPGNAGIAGLASCIALSVDDHAGIGDFAESNAIDLVVVGPEAPLVAGISDALTVRGLRVFGPSAAAARIEGSKAWAKELMGKAGIPTATARAFDDAGDAIAYARTLGGSCVVKADGLAAGKGVRMCATSAEAEEAVRDCLERGVFGDAGSRVLIEEMLTGEELSVFCVTDGTTVLPLAAAQDHKRLLDGDRGPNTGGMGAYSPVAHLDHLVERVVAETFEPLIERMKAEGSPFTGVLFGGFMVTPDGPKVLEFNCRFGDPEAQVILPRLRSDVGDLLRACAGGTLDRVKLEWSPDAAVCVVVAGRGYPERSDAGTPVAGLGAAASRGLIFHAGTAEEDGVTVTRGGRILGVTGIGPSVADARAAAYAAVEEVSFDGMQYRTDIGAKAVAAGEGE